MIIKISNTRVDKQGSRVIDNIDDDSFILTSEDMAVIEAILETDIDVNFQFSTSYTGDHHWWLKCYEDDCTIYKFSDIQDMHRRATMINVLIIEEYLKWIGNMARLLVRDKSIKFDYHIPHNNVISKLIKWYDRQELDSALDGKGRNTRGVLQLISTPSTTMPEKVREACFSKDLSLDAATQTRVSAVLAGEYYINDFALNNLIYFRNLDSYYGNVYQFRTGLSPKIDEMIDNMGLTDVEERVARSLISYIRGLI